MQPMPAKKAEEVAKTVNDLSQDYHLSHAVFACNRVVEDVFKQYSKTRIKKLKERLLDADRTNDTEKIAEIKIDIRSLERPFRIYVEYVNDMDIYGGRVVKLVTSNQFVISLPKRLLDKSRNEDGSYNPGGVKILRQRMAHEIGHIALHVEDLLEIDGTQGANLLSKESEDEANIFARELLRLRHERNEQLFRTGIYKDAF